jgi:threonine/homoserine/homoserine lactone efflux protein
MPGIVNLSLFIITSAIIVIAPGPDFMYVTTRGISQGKRAGTLSALGISAGLLIHTLLAAFGLSAIIQASRFAYLAIKYIGAGYLIFLGIKALIEKKRLSQGLETNAGGKNSFHQGVLTNLFNPKAIVTFMAFLPQFVDVRISHPMLQFMFLGMIISLLAVIWFGIVGYSAGLISAFLKRSQLFQNGLRYLSGSVLLLLGLRLAIKEE